MVSKRVGSSTLCINVRSLIPKNQTSSLRIKMKGGYMKKNTKKFLALSVLGMFMLMFAMQFVAAEDGIVETTPGVSAVITEPAWLVAFINFMGFGQSWSTLIASLAVLMMIFAAAYDILAFSAFESKWVKYGIAGGIAVITAVSRGVTLIVAGFMAIAGGSVAIATTIAIFLAIGFFIIGTFFKGKMKGLKYKAKAEAAEGAFEMAKAKVVGDVKTAKAAADAAK